MSAETTSTTARDPPRPKNPQEPASPAQRGFLATHGVDSNAANDPALTKGQASDWITGIIEAEKKGGAPAKAAPPVAQRTPPTPPTPSPAPEPEFVTGDKLQRSPAVSTELAVEEDEIRTVAGTLVLPEIGIDRAKGLWNRYLEFREVILSDPACYDEIDGKKDMNRTGATRLALPFGLSIEERSIEEGRVELADTGTYDYRYRVRVRVSKGSRFVDGIGSCRMSEISPKAGDASRREHFALTKAWTRATKRAISDMLGGGTESE